MNGLTIHLPRSAGLSIEIFVDRPAKVSWSMDTFYTSLVTASVLKCIDVYLLKLLLRETISAHAHLPKIG